MTEYYTKVEIVRPGIKGAGEWFRAIATAIVHLALDTLIVWWFFAAWFPNFGLTYWQLALPVYAIRALTSHPVGRQL